MLNEKWNDPQLNPNYCGYCKCEPCICDGHGNYGGERDGLDLIESIESIEDEVVDEDEQEEGEGELTYEDGTPYDPDANKHQRAPRPATGRVSYRPQRPPR